MADPTTESLRVEQIERERAERGEAHTAANPAEARQHRRRADKAGYLREKLAERAAAEERAEEEA